MNGSIPGGNATRKLSRFVNDREGYTAAKRAGNRRLRRTARNLARYDEDEATDTFRFASPTTERDVS